MRPLYLLPGMGADAQLYRGPWRGLDFAVFLDWPPYRSFSRLDELAAQTIHHYRLPPGACVGGSSLGGMVALEMARQLRSPEVVLFGAAVDPGEISALLRHLTPAVWLCPMGFAQYLAGMSSDRLAEMFRKVDAQYLRHSCSAIGRWQGAGDLPSRRHRLHGGKDRIIRCPPEAEVLPDAGHLITWFKAGDCVRWLRRRWRELESETIH